MYSLLCFFCFFCLLTKRTTAAPFQAPGHFFFEVVLKNTVDSLSWRALPAEAVQSATGLLEAEDDAKDSNSLSGPVYHQGITDQVLQTPKRSS